MDDDQTHRDGHGKRPRATGNDGTPKSGGNSRQPSKNASSVRVANPKSGGGGGGANRNSVVKPKQNPYEVTSEWLVTWCGLDGGHEQHVIDIAGVGRELRVSTSCVTKCLTMLARTGAVKWLGGDVYRWTGLRKFNRTVDELLVGAKDMFPADGQAKARATKLVKEVLHDGKQKLSKFGTFEATLQLISASDIGVDLDDAARRMFNLVLSEKSPGRSSLTNVTQILANVAYCMVGFGAMRKVNYERAGVKRVWLKWVGLPKEQGQKQRRQREEALKKGGEGGSSVASIAGLNINAKGRSGADAKSIEMDRIQELKRDDSRGSSSSHTAESAIARPRNCKPGKIPESVKGPVNADRPRFRKNPKVLPFMAVAGKEGERSPPLWDPRMGPGRKWHRREADTTAPPALAQASGSGISTNPASSDRPPCGGAAGSAPTVHQALQTPPDLAQTLVQPRRGRDPSTGGNDAMSDADAHTRTPCRAGIDAHVYAHAYACAYAHAHAHAPVSADAGKGGAGPVATPSVATRAPSPVAACSSGETSRSNHTLDRLQGVSSSPVKDSEPRSPSNTRVCAPTRPPTPASTPTPYDSGGGRGATVGVPNASDFWGAGSGLPVLSGGGAHASKDRGVPAVSDEIHHSGALTWEGATEASDSAGTSHAASSSGGSYPLSSSGGSSDSEHSSDSPNRALSSPSRKYRRSVTPSGSSRMSRSDRRSEPPFRSSFEAAPSTATTTDAAAATIATSVSSARCVGGSGGSGGGGGGGGGGGSGSGGGNGGVGVGSADSGVGVGASGGGDGIGGGSSTNSIYLLPRALRNRKATPPELSQSSVRDISASAPRTKSGSSPMPRVSSAGAGVGAGAGTVRPLVGRPLYTPVEKLVRGRGEGTRSSLMSSLLSLSLSPPPSPLSSMSLSSSSSSSSSPPPPLSAIRSLYMSRGGASHRS